MWDWRRALAFGSLFGLVAPIYFLVFWGWFEFWRKRRALWFAMLGGVLAGVLDVGYVFRSLLWSRQIVFPLWAQVIGWALFAAATILGTVADRQIGIRVRSFRPFFEGERGHIDLVTTRAFGIVRHPIYSAGIGCLIGLFFVSGYPSVAVMAAVFSFSALWFTRQEEKRLVALLDDPISYERYRERVPALIPLPRFRSRGRGPAT